MTSATAATAATAATSANEPVARGARATSTDRFPKKNENVYTNQNIPNQNIPKNISALPPFMFNQPPSNPLQPLLDLFQNNSSYPQSNDYGMFQNQNQYTQHPNTHPMNQYHPTQQFNSHNNGGMAPNHMQNYLNGISGTNLYNNQASVNPYNHMNAQQKNPFNIHKPNHMQNPNINYSTGNI